ncbi:daptide-type RiPP biosynthesis methyltransferase [Microbacterium sp. p3-SID336]|uniref:daptide-type RiPP biosynthesis methyltransferase n=1 Tax=Microbacterium sp. p3-SID336 TaxID=2916212 RepID=UPI0021A48778|nr:daptide-type RiPP biosynthesis methyltransferase [Microbacterium sp. p3-SID336]MCT1477617.1 class I SAM-dependent methyltransferase [Microbacterium sp. p3-SID336]
MTQPLTETIGARLRAAGAVARAQDLYEGAGTDFYERLVGGDPVEIREVLALARTTGDPILDLAAGSGRLTIPLVRSGRRVTALDSSSDMLSRLRRALPDHPLLDGVVADMRSFALGRVFPLIVLGATSITLLDRAGRARLYAAVQGHLAAGGVFALTVAGGASATELSSPQDREITVPGPDGAQTYLFSQQIEDGGSTRLVNWVRVADVAPHAEVTVLTSRLRLLDAHHLARELVDAGFVTPAITAVRAHPGVDILLLATTWPDAPRRGGPDVRG